MLAQTYRVTIERHEVEDIPALTFQCDREGPAGCPLVFALHGLTSRKERHLDLCLRLADAGFRACSFDARSHGERQSDDTAVLSGDRTDPAFGPAFIRTVSGTVEDMMGLAHYFGVDRYAIVGHSMGGFIAMQTALYDPRVMAVVNISGSLDLVGSRSPSDIPPEHAEILARVDVAARAAELRPRPILLLHGEQDTIVPVTGATRLYTALRTAYGDEADQVKLVLYPENGHEFTPAMAQEAVIWLSNSLPRG